MRRTSLNSKKTMTKEEKKEWSELFEYVKREILQYDESQKMPSSFALALRGLSTGKVMDNKKELDEADYSFKVILYTFQICKPQIMQALSGKDFKSECSKFVYICKIVESNINDVYLRLEKAEKARDKTEQIETNNLAHKGASYKQKTKVTQNNKLKNLW